MSAEAGTPPGRRQARIISWQEMHRDARALACRLEQTPMAGRWRAVAAIARGGLAPAGILARELDIRHVETLSVRSYAHQSQGEVEVISGPAPALGSGAGVLVVDDLSDTGRTLSAVRRLLPEAHFATLYVKPLGKPMADSFAAEIAQEVWIHFPWDLELVYAPPLRGEG